MTQSAELARVSMAIGKSILEFRDSVGASCAFRCEDLRHYVTSRVPNISPDSPSRVLRDLRKKGALDYRVLDRRASLYEFTS